MFRRLEASKAARWLLAAGLLLAVPACKKGKGKKSTETPNTAAAIEKAKSNAKAQSLLDLANADLEKGRYVSARKRADEALLANPENADAHAVLGAARWRAGDFVGSTEAYTKAVELAPRNFGAALGLARNLQMSGDHRKAIELQDTLLKEDAKQVDPMVTKLWSLHALGEADEAVKVVDEIFKYLPADDPQLPLIQATAAFVRALEGKGPLLQLEGESGTSDLQVDVGSGFKHSLAQVGTEPARVILFENHEEAIIDAKLVKKLKLKRLAKYKPAGEEEEIGIVVIPSIKFGDLTLKKVPAVVRSLSEYESVIGERPGVVLGRQAMQAFGSITFDFPKYSLEVTAKPPSEAPSGAAEVPLLLLDFHLLRVPAIPVRIDGSKEEFFVYFGGVYKAGIAVTKKAYLKSGHLPRHVDPPDDPAQGLKMVYVDKIHIGSLDVPGVGGLVMVNEPADANLGTILTNTAFELSGYLNLTAVQHWKVTYAISSGKAYIEVPAKG